MIRPEDIADITELPQNTEISGKGWLLLEATPLPPAGELEQVTHDLLNNRPVAVIDGQVRHSWDCSDSNHALSYTLRKLLHSLPRRTFYVAIYPAVSDLPWVIPIEPEISYNNYPHHPHLNGSGFCTIDGVSFFRPNTICYTRKPVAAIGICSTDRLAYAVWETCVWLFRHQLWEAAPELGWPGPSIPHLPHKMWQEFNPFGPCRCGSKVEYFNCHMKSDVMKNYSWLSPVKAGRVISGYIVDRVWPKCKRQPHIDTINGLRKSLVTLGRYKSTK